MSTVGTGQGTAADRPVANKAEANIAGDEDCSQQIFGERLLETGNAAGGRQL